MLQGALPRVIAGLLRRTWLVAGITTTICAGFAAQAVSSWTADDEPEIGAHAPRAQATPARSVARSRPDGGSFVARNMFCSTCEPSAGSGPADPLFSGADVVLIATAIGASDGSSSATVRVVPTDAQGSFSVGDEIPRVGTVAEITRGWIDVVDRGGRHARLSLADTRSRGAATPSQTAAAGAPESPYADRVKKIDDATYEADRSLFKELVAGVTKPGAVRAVPVLDHGEVVGIRLGGVTAQSIPAAFGLKSGDVLTAIDGAPLKTANQVLELYAKIDSVSSVELGGTRGGKPMTLTLRLR